MKQVLRNTKKSTVADFWYFEIFDHFFTQKPQNWPKWPFSALNWPKNDQNCEKFKNLQQYFFLYSYVLASYQFVEIFDQMAKTSYIFKLFFKISHRNPYIFADFGQFRDIFNQPSNLTSWFSEVAWAHFRISMAKAFTLCKGERIWIHHFWPPLPP
jgi:hypothetical protein